MSCDSGSFLSRVKAVHCFLPIYGRDPHPASAHHQNIAAFVKRCSACVVTVDPSHLGWVFLQREQQQQQQTKRPRTMTPTTTAIVMMKASKFTRSHKNRNTDTFFGFFFLHHVFLWAVRKWLVLSFELQSQMVKQWRPLLAIPFQCIDTINRISLRFRLQGNATCTWDRRFRQWHCVRSEITVAAPITILLA